VANSPAGLSPSTGLYRILNVLLARSSVLSRTDLLTASARERCVTTPIIPVLSVTGTRFILLSRISCRACLTVPIEEIVTRGNVMTDFREVRFESSPLSTTFSTTSPVVTIPIASPCLVTITDSNLCDCISWTAEATLAFSSMVTNCLCMYDFAGLSSTSWCCMSCLAQTSSLCHF